MATGLTVAKFANKILNTSKKIKSAGCTSWQYLKMEIIPIMTANIWSGPLGKMGGAAGKMANTFFTLIGDQMKAIDIRSESKNKEKSYSKLGDPKSHVYTFGPKEAVSNKYIRRR